jgi:Tol biopolymer transport system component
MATYPGSNGVIAYESYAGIWTTNPDGSDQHLLRRGCEQPAWSPSGRLLALACARGLFIVNSDGSGLRQVTSNDDGLPSFSPSGKRIVFLRNNDDNEKIVSVRIDGSHQRVLAYPRHGPTWPTYSPNGTWIAYVQGVPGTEDFAIYLMHRDGSDKHRVGPAEAPLLGVHPESPDVACA